MADYRDHWQEELESATEAAEACQLLAKGFRRNRTSGAIYCIGCGVTIGQLDLHTPDTCEPMKRKLAEIETAPQRLAGLERD